MSLTVFKGSVLEMCESVFLWSAAGILTATGALKILAVLFGHAQGVDPIFQFANRYLWMALGGMEMGIAFYLVQGRKLLFKHYLIFFLSLNFLLYRGALHFIAPDQSCPCLGKLETSFVFPNNAVGIALTAMAIYLFLLSFIFFLFHSLNAIHRKM